MERLHDDWRMVAGTKIYARVANAVSQGSTSVVLIHGLGVSGTYMLPLARHLGASYAVYVPDLPGWGKSAKLDRALTIPELTDALAGWICAVGLPPAAFVANSLGCQIVVELAVRFPQFLERAVLIGPPMRDSAGRSIMRQAVRGAVDVLREPWSLWPILVKDYLAMGPLRVIRTLQYGLKDPLEEKLPLIHVPTLFLRGARDPIAPLAWVQSLARRLPHAQILEIHGAAHAAHFSAPAAVAQAVHAFIKQEKLVRIAG